MSEKIYACLLRLYPRRFRETYGDEAIQLFRDRSLNERELFLRLRLWPDLLIDLFASVPREHLRVTRKLAPAPKQQSLWNECPAFGLIDSSCVSLRQVIAGGLLSLLSFLMFLFSLNYGRDNHPPNTSSSPMQSVDLWRPLMPQGRSAHNSSDDSDVVVLGKQAFDARIRTQSKMIEPNASQRDLLTVRIHSEGSQSGNFGTPAEDAFWSWLCAFNSGDPTTLDTYIKTIDPADTVNSELRFRKRTGGFYIQEVLINERQFMRVLLRDRNSWTRFLASIRVRDGVFSRVVSFGLVQVPRGSDAEEVEVDSQEKRGVIVAVISDLKQYYAYPKLAKKMAHSLVTHEKRGDDDLESDGIAFADLLTRQMRSVSDDRDLQLTYVLYERNTNFRPNNIEATEQRRSKNLKRAKVVGEPPGVGAPLATPHEIDEHFVFGVPSGIQLTR